MKKRSIKSDTFRTFAEKRFRNTWIKCSTLNYLVIFDTNLTVHSLSSKALIMQKNTKNAFFPVLGLMSDRLTTRLVESHWCLLHQFVLLTQGPILLNFVKKILRIDDFEKHRFFESAILEIFMITLVSSPWGLGPIHRTVT